MQIKQAKEYLSLAVSVVGFCGMFIYFGEYKSKVERNEKDIEEFREEFKKVDEIKNGIDEILDVVGD